MPYRWRWRSESEMLRVPVRAGDCRSRDRTGSRSTPACTTIRFSVGGLFLASRGDDNRAWQGRFTGNAGMASLELGPPDGSPHERARAHLQQAESAKRSGRDQNALVELQQAAALDPSDVVSAVELGRMYLRLNRYADAIGPLEQAIRLAPPDLNITSIGSALAKAYLGVNDEPNAVRALRQSRVSEQLIPETIRQLRSRIAEGRRP